MDLHLGRIVSKAHSGTAALEPALLLSSSQTALRAEHCKLCLNYSFSVCTQALHLGCLQAEETNTTFGFLVHDDAAPWQHWKDCVPWEHPKMRERPSIAQLIMPALDSVRHDKLLMLCYSFHKVKR